MIDITEEYFNEVNSIIVGISVRSIYKIKSYDLHDLIQELWLQILSQIEEKESEIDYNLVAKICYDKIVDIIRYESRRKHLDILEYIDYNINYESFEDILFISQIKNLFPEGSKERIFVEYWMESVGIEDFNYRPLGRNNDGYTETNISKILGFRGTGDRGYKKFRENIRNKIFEIIS